MKTKTLLIILSFVLPSIVAMRGGDSASEKQDTELDGRAILAKSKDLTLVPGSSKLVTTTIHSRLIRYETTYVKIKENGDRFTRSDEKRVIDTYSESLTRLTFPDGQIWKILGNVAIKFPYMNKDAAVQKTRQDIADEVDNKIKTLDKNNHKDIAYQYLCEPFLRNGKKSYRVIEIQPKLLTEIIKDRIPDFVQLSAGTTDRQVTRKMQDEAADMVKASISTRHEYVIDAETFRLLESTAYTEKGKKTEGQIVNSYAVIEELDDSFFEIPKECRLLYPKNLKEYISLLKKYPGKVTKTAK